MCCEWVSSRFLNLSGGSRNTTSALSTAWTRGAVKRSAATRCPSTTCGVLTVRNAASPIAQS